MEVVKCAQIIKVFPKCQPVNMFASIRHTELGHSATEAIRIIKKKRRRMKRSLFAGVV